MCKYYEHLLFSFYSSLSCSTTFFFYFLCLFSPLLNIFLSIRFLYLHSLTLEMVGEKQHRKRGDIEWMFRCKIEKNEKNRIHRNCFPLSIPFLLYYQEVCPDNKGDILLPSIVPAFRKSNEARGIIYERPLGPRTNRLWRPAVTAYLWLNTMASRRARIFSLERSLCQQAAVTAQQSILAFRSMRRKREREVLWREMWKKTLIAATGCSCQMERRGSLRLLAFLRGPACSMHEKM